MAVVNLEQPWKLEEVISIFRKCNHTIKIYLQNTHIKRFQEHKKQKGGEKGCLP